MVVTIDCINCKVTIISVMQQGPGGILSSCMLFSVYYIQLMEFLL